MAHRDRPDAATGCNYLVEIRVHIPPEIPPSRRKELMAAELLRGRELRSAGTIQRIWRIPGALANVGIWQAADVTELQDRIASLPLFPYMDTLVTALAEHPVESQL